MAVRKSLGDIYRPAGPKAIQTGIQWTSGGSAAVAQAIDLSLPIRGIRLVLKGRLVIGTAAFTSVGPEGFLNLISSIIIQGTNARQKGNVTLWNIDLATAWVMSHLYAFKGCGLFTILTGGVESSVPVPDTPFPVAGTAVPNKASGYINGATGTYDFRIVCDFPFHPHEMNGLGKSPYSIPGFLVRNEEWKDSMQILMTFGAQAGNSTGCLGVAAATTTVTFSGYAGVGANPTIDLYSLPVLSGLDLKDQVLPGVYSRTSQPINTILQAAGTTSTLLNMQKQPTTRVILKTGTSTVGAVAPAFATLGDTSLVTALGIQLGGNRNVRNKVDLFTHKMQQVDVHDREPIQGYTLLDFMDSGNHDSSFPGQDIGDGATFQLVADTPGLANGFGLVVQEQMIHLPTGPLYNY